MRRIRRRWVILGLALLIPAAGLGWWLGSPLFISRTVEEAFPMAGSAIVPPGMTRAEVEAVMAGMAKVELEMSEPMPEAMAGAQTLKRGEFRDADSFHRGSGQAVIYRLADGSHVLRLEELNVTNGPALHVLLVPHPDPGSREEVAGYLDLGRLKGNIGSQNYEIPPGTDVAPLMSVVIYCKPFHVLFAVAPLGEAG